MRYKHQQLLILIFISFLFLYGCNSNDYPTQAVTGPSKVSGTVFAAPLEIDAGENPVGMAIGDFNLDNETDFVVASARKQSGYTTVADGALTFFQKNNETDSFPYDNSSLTPSTAEWRQDILAADFTGDNNTDLVVTSTDLDQITLLRNVNGTFVDNGTLTVGDVPLHLVSGDWNSDNQTDLAVVNRDNSSISILTNSSGVFSISSTLNYDSSGTLYYPIRIISEDWDNDSDSDLAVLWKGNTIVQTFLNNAGTFTADKTITVGVAPRDMISGDWDFDGYQDMAISNYSDDTLTLLYGDGSGAFTTVTITAADGPGALAYADFDNDSQMDFVVGHHFTLSTLSVSQMTGDVSLTLSDNTSKRVYGTPDKFAATLSSDGAPPAEIHICDVDSDGKLDVLMAVPLTKKLTILSGIKYTGQTICQ